VSGGATRRHTADTAHASIIGALAANQSHNSLNGGSDGQGGIEDVPPLAPLADEIPPPAPLADDVPAPVPLVDAEPPLAP